MLSSHVVWVQVAGCPHETLVPGVKASWGPALWGQCLGDVGALFLPWPVVASPAPSPLATSILIRHLWHELMAGTAIRVPPPFPLPGPLSSGEKKGEVTTHYLSLFYLRQRSSFVSPLHPQLLRNKSIHSGYLLMYNL